MGYPPAQASLGFAQKDKARLPKQTGFVGDIRGDLGSTAESKGVTDVRRRHHRGSRRHHRRHGSHRRRR